MADREIIAWDSCIIIDAIQKHPEKYPDIQQMIIKAEAGELSIVISSISLAEVRYCKELNAQGVTQNNQDKLISRWFDNSYVIKRVADVGICGLAASLGRQYPDNLTPLDSIILSTAIDRKAKTLVTYDDNNGRGGLLALDGQVGNPPLRIKRPEDWAIQPEIKFPSN